MSDSADPDQMSHFAASDLGLHGIHSPVCPNTSGNVFIQKLIILLIKHDISLSYKVGSYGDGF